MTQDNDPLAMPASELKEPTFPLWKPDEIYTFLIKDAEEGESKQENEKTGLKSKFWVIKLEATEDRMSTEDQLIYKGALLTHREMLSPSERRSAKQIAENASMIIKAALGKATTVSVRQCLQDKSLLVGKLVNVKLGIQKGKDNFPDTNVVKKWILPA